MRIEDITPEEYEIAEKNGIKRSTLKYRVEKNWDIETAITKKPKYNRDLKPELLDLAKQNGISYKAYYKRVKYKNMDEVEAAVIPPNDYLESLKKGTEAKRKFPQHYLDLAEKNGIKYSTFYQRMRSNWDIEKAATTPPASKKGTRQKRKIIPNEYAVYRGEEYICSGTAKECAEQLGIRINTIYRYLSDTYKKELESRTNTENSLFIVCLDDDDEEDEDEAI